MLKVVLNGQPRTKFFYNHVFRHILNKEAQKYIVLEPIEHKILRKNIKKKKIQALWATKPDGRFSGPLSPMGV